jgi:hypothetical protein
MISMEHFKSLSLINVPIALGCGNKAADILHNYSLTHS